MFSWIGRVLAMEAKAVLGGWIALVGLAATFLYGGLQLVVQSATYGIGVASLWLAAVLTVLWLAWVVALIINLVARKRKKKFPNVPPRLHTTAQSPPDPLQRPDATLRGIHLHDIAGDGIVAENATIDASDIHMSKIGGRGIAVTGGIRDSQVTFGDNSPISIGPKQRAIPLDAANIDAVRPYAGTWIWVSSGGGGEEKKFANNLVEFLTKAGWEPHTIGWSQSSAAVSVTGVEVDLVETEISPAIEALVGLLKGLKHEVTVIVNAGPPTAGARLPAEALAAAKLFVNPQ